MGIKPLAKPSRKRTLEDNTVNDDPLDEDLQQLLQKRLAVHGEWH
jgi:hypothetical protein